MCVGAIRLGENVHAWDSVVSCAFPGLVLQSWVPCHVLVLQVVDVVFNCCKCLYMVHMCVDDAYDRAVI